MAKQPSEGVVNDASDRPETEVPTQPERTSVCSLGFDTPTKPTKAAQRLRTSRLKPQTKLESWHNRGSVKTSHICLNLPAVIT